jgi:putative peptide zinc metalloprotease protein
MINDMGMLPPLREELSLHAGPSDRDGAPSWTIRDPVRNRFFRISWPAFEMLSRWHLGTAPLVAQTVSAETSLLLTPDEVEGLARFLMASQLTRPQGPADTRRLAQRAAAERHSLFHWLLHHYLFFRIPLVRPDRVLARTLPLVRWLGGGWFRALTVAALVLGLVLVQRRFEDFAATLVDTFSPAGLLGYGIALTLVKVVHELAHAYTARNFGCRVPTMGAAFLVMWSVLYTDVNETWMLSSRRQRLLVGAAGIAAELTLAAWATLAWAFLPDGPVRQAAFVVAALTWISSLVINLSPFMRFDGYFLLMDGLEMPNLHPRAFAMARWWLREALFRLGEPAPEPLPATTRRALVAFAFAVWIYRLVLFLGIAVLVYHFFIKAVGIVLFAVEIGWFVIMPLVNECREWVKRREAIGRGGFWRWPAAAGLALLIGAALPWPSRIEAPAIIRAAPVTALYLPMPGRLARIHVARNTRVSAGQILYSVESPDLEHRLAVLAARQAGRISELETARLDAAFRDRVLMLTEDIARLAAERSALEAERQRLSITAPHDGIFTDPPPVLLAGEWISPRLGLGIVRGHGPAIASAYVGEHDASRFGPGAAATLVPHSLDHPRLSGRVVGIDPSPIRSLADGALANIHQGPIPVRMTAQALVPESSWTRLTIALDAPAADTELPAIALIEGESESPLARLLRSALVVLVREWGT